MRMLALAVLAVALTACPEPIAPPAPPRKPPQAALASGVASPAAGVNVLTVKRPAEPEWFGLYLLGQKAGWTRVHLVREVRDGKDVLVGRSESLLSATVGGKAVERRQTEERVYEARPGGALLSFRAEWAGDGGARTLTGTCAPAGCRATTVNGDGTTVVRELPPVRETADQADAARLAAARRTTLVGEQLDLEKLRIKTVKDVFLRREKIAGAGVEEEVSVVAESEAEDRIAAESRIADDGRVLEIRLGEAVVARPEPEELARRLDVVDLFALARVPVPAPLPATVPATIVFRLTGLPAAFQQPDGRQSFAKAPDGATVLTVVARPPRAADPAKDTPRVRAASTGDAAGADLAPTPQLDSDHPAIRALAQELAGDVPGTYAAARKLSDAVHRRLEKAYGASHDRASEVLAAGRGDCTEHATLFVALARALGIPARTVHGLVHARYEDGVPALYWHAWAEVRSGGEWIAMDPTFGQPVADATHVALGAGAQVDTVGLLGALKVQGVEVKTDFPRSAP